MGLFSWLVEVGDDNGNHVVIEVPDQSSANDVVNTLKSEIGAVPDQSDRYMQSYYAAREWDRSNDPNQFKYSAAPLCSGNEDDEDSDSDYDLTTPTGGGRDYRGFTLSDFFNW